MTVALVTGATGFIGRRLSKALCEANVNVKAVSRSESVDVDRAWAHEGITPIVADLTRAASLDKICTDVDVVFHLAGYAHTAEANDERAVAIHRALTVEGTRALLKEARRAGVKRFVFASSVKAIGEGGEQCIDETASVLPTTEYGRAKLEAERLVLAHGRDSGIHVCVLRLPLVYGPGVRGNLLHMIRTIDRNRFPPLPAADNKRSMVHVDDVVRALRLAGENPKANGEVYLVTDGRVYSTYEIYNLIRRALGKTMPNWSVPLGALRAVAHVGDAIGHMRSYPFFFNSAVLSKLFASAWYSSKKVEQHLQFHPTQTLEEALPMIIEEYRKSGG